MKVSKSKFKVSILSIATLVILSLVLSFPLSSTASVLSKTDKLFTYGASSLRIGTLGGEVGVTDSSNPLKGTSLSIGTNTFLSDDSPFIRFQVDNAGKIKKDSKGRPRILVTEVTKKTTSFKRNAIILKPKKTSIKPVEFILTEPFFSEINEQHDNILVLYIDTTGDGDADKFPSYFIKDIGDKVIKLPKKYGVTITKKKKGKEKEKIGVAGVFFNKAKFPVITTFTDIVTQGTIKLIQVLEVPHAIIQSGTPLKVKNGWVAVGPPVTISSLTTLADTTAPSSLNNATLTVPYFTDVVSALGIDEADLKIFRNKGAKISSKIADTLSIDSSAGSASISNVTEFGTYQVLGKTSGQSKSLPSIRTLKAKADRNGNVKIAYTLVDANGDKSNVKIEYRKNPTIDGTTGWKTIKTVKNVKSSSKKIQKLTWKSKSDIGKDAGYFQIRVTPLKNIDGTQVKGVFKTTDIFRIETANGAPKPPSKLKVRVKNKSKNEVGADGNDSKPPQVALSWSKSSGGVAGYNVYRQARFRNGIEDTFSIIKTINGSTTSYKDNSDNGTLTASFLEAFYAVTAFDSSGKESDLSKPLSAASIVFGSYYYYSK